MRVEEFSGQSGGMSDAGVNIRLGLLGQGIGLSRTPRMHMREAAQHNISCQYDLLDPYLRGGPKDIQSLLCEVETAGYRGVNVTYPYKQQVMAHLDTVSDTARVVGAVNTVVFRDGKRAGHNTDYWGYYEAFRRQMPDARLCRVMLIGAGGAGAAVAHALLDIGVGQLVLADINAANADALIAALNAKHGAGRAIRTNSMDAEAAFVDGIVNATPVGMVAHPGYPVSPDLLQPQQWISDVIYFPLETALVKAARAKGCRVQNGTGMAVYQAVRAFKLFTGETPDPVRMQATFESFDPVMPENPASNTQ